MGTLSATKPAFCYCAEERPLPPLDNGIIDVYKGYCNFSLD